MSATTRKPSRFVRLARVCNRHRWRTFLVWLVALIAIQAAAGAVGTKKISTFRLPGTESQRAYDLLADHFPAQKGDTDQIVFRARSGKLDDPATKARITAALKRTETAPDVRSVDSLFGPRGQITKDGTIGVASLNYDKSTNDIEPADLEKAQDAMFTARSRTLQVEHGGPGAEVVRFENTQGPSEFIGVLAATIVLVFTFGSLVAAGLPLIATLLALGSSLGLITLLSHVVDTPDFAAQLASLIGLGVGIDYALFVVTRFRAEIRGGMDRELAIEKAVDTAGRTVLFAAITVVIALLGLLLLGLSFMQGVALGAATTVLAVMFAALTIVPAMIGGSRGFIDGVFHEFDTRGGFRFWGTKRRLHIPGVQFRARRAARREQRRSEGSGWARWSNAVQRRPWLAASIAIVVLLALALPATQLRLGSSDAGVDPPGSTTRAAYHLIAEGFGAGTNGSFLLVAQLAQKHDKAAAARIAAAVKADKDFTFVAPAAV